MIAYKYDNVTAELQSIKIFKVKNLAKACGLLGVDCIREEA